MATEHKSSHPDASLVHGFMKLLPNATKPSQKTAQYELFLELIKGKVSIKIGNQEPEIIEAASSYQKIPPSTLYSITNLLAQEAIFKFIIFKFWLYTCVNIQDYFGVAWMLSNHSNKSFTNHIPLLLFGLCWSVFRKSCLTRLGD